MAFNSSTYTMVCDIQRRSKEENSIAALVILLLSGVSMIGNGLVLISFANCCQLRQQKGSYFMANLALSDFLCSVYVMLPCAACLFDTDWKMADVTCSFHGTFNSTFFTSSTLSLTAINVDRAIAINRPFDYPNIMTWFRVKVAVIFIWIQCLMLATVSGIAGWVSFQNWELMCVPVWSRSNFAYATIAVTLSFIVPSVLVLASNISIVYAIRRSRSVVFQVCPATYGNGGRMCVKKYTKTLRSLYLLVVVYFLCCTPYYVVKYGSAFHGRNFIKEGSCFVPIGLLFLAACVNPLIYALLIKEHRKAFVDTLLMLIEKCKKVRLLMFKHPPPPPQE